MTTKYLNHKQAYERFFKKSEVKFTHSSNKIRLSISEGHDSNIHLFLTVPEVWSNPRYLGFFEEVPDEKTLVYNLRNKVLDELRTESRNKEISLGSNKELIFKLVDPLLNGLVEKLRLSEERRKSSKVGARYTILSNNSRDKTSPNFNTSRHSDKNRFPGDDDERKSWRQSKI